MKLFILLITLFLVNQDFLSAEDVLRPKGKSSTSTYTSDSKKRFSLGGELGLNYNMYSADMTWNPQLDEPILQIFETGEGLSPYIGLFIDFEVNETFGIHTKLQYNNINLNYDGNNGIGLIDCEIMDGNGTVVKAEVSSEASQEFNYIVLEPLLRININENLFVLIGPSLQFATGNITTNWTQTIIDEDCYFNFGTPDQSKVNTTNTETPFTDNRVGINASVGYLYSISRNISISPQLHLHIMPGKAAPDEFDNPDNTQPITEGSSFYDNTNKSLQNIRLSVSIWFENLY